MLKQMNATLKSYATSFAQQDETKAEIRTSVDKMSNKMEKRITKFKDLDTCFDVMDFSLEEIEFWSTSTTKNNKA